MLVQMIVSQVLINAVRSPHASDSDASACAQATRCRATSNRPFASANAQRGNGPPPRFAKGYAGHCKSTVPSQPSYAKGYGGHAVPPHPRQRPPPGSVVFAVLFAREILCLIPAFVRQPPRGHPASSPFASLRARLRRTISALSRSVGWLALFQCSNNQPTGKRHKIVLGDHPASQQGAVAGGGVAGLPGMPF